MYHVSYMITYLSNYIYIYIYSCNCVLYTIYRLLSCRAQVSWISVRSKARNFEKGRGLV